MMQQRHPGDSVTRCRWYALLAESVYLCLFWLHGATNIQEECWFHWSLWMVLVCNWSFCCSLCSWRLTVDNH